MGNGIWILRMFLLALSGCVTIAIYAVLVSYTHEMTLTGLVYGGLMVSIGLLLSAWLDSRS